ncbi:DEAD/DEAH box helicase [Brevibacillus laterosporus]|uniref:DEAD/DEAH box helicase n=1 Tax=Brevibacillus laterosporus TaxID=1465 RepID=A0AAP8U687_BRELA|nr:DEAD/DEAH box helicase [Brevibacillus laterosporus]PPB08842.1 DEAD/DEAH box helicase [Brevibacillus laterosporus]
MGFKSRYQGQSEIESPESLFYDLRNRKVEGLLAHQADVLRVYKEKLEHPDVAMELPTGSGKTLIGLLAGEYRRIMRQERVVFLCPTKQLVHQVVEEAKSKYDIHPIAFTGSQRDYLPSDKSKYNDGEAIAVTTYSSLFNTKPFFHNPQFIILDDAHASENYLVKYWSLSISRSKHSIIYDQFLEIVKDTLPHEQYQRMTSESPSPSDRSWVEKIPTPNFVGLINKIIPFLDQFTTDYKDLKHTWSIIRDHLTACHVYLNWSGILIRPFIPPSQTHHPFSMAKQRLYMSATLGLGGELERITGRRKIERIKAPEGWDKHGVGRRLFFFPGTTLDEVESQEVAVKLADVVPRTLLLVPDDKSANKWVEHFTEKTEKTVYQAEDIEKTKTNFTSDPNAVAVLANRYDGINLTGDECRLEIMMGLPTAANLQERFLETRMVASILLQDRVRTRIVQAIGRCTRSATDYSAVCILGDDLQDRLLQKENLRLYHPELQAELAFGNEESKQTKKIDEFIELYRYFLNQGSPEWRSADKEIIARRNDAQQKSIPLMTVLEETVVLEHDYQQSLWAGDYVGAFEKASRIASLLSGDELKGYRGFWYYLAGSAAWLADKYNKNNDYITCARQKFQQAAKCTLSVTWLRNLGDSEHGGEKHEQNDNRLPFLIERLENELITMGTTSDTKFEKRVKSILEGLSNNTDGKLFERAHEDLGKLLGYRAGNSGETSAPDPWWIAGNDFCLVAEDFTETDGKKPISAHKVRQANGHPTWISRMIEGLTEKTTYIRVIISPSVFVEESALIIAQDIAYWNQSDFVQWAHKAVQVIRELRLDFTGVGDEQWRINAMAAYRDAGLDPTSIQKNLEKSPLTKLK